MSILIVEPIFSQTDSVSTTSRKGIVREKNNRDTILPDTVIYSWRYLSGFVKFVAEVDTAPHTVLYRDPSRVGKYYQIGLGNLGQPVMNSNFFERKEIELSNHWMIQYFDPYLQYHEKIKVFNTKTPFTRLYYTSSNRKWQTFHFTHTQNINNDINLGVLYNIYSSLGSYVYQSSRNRNGSFWIDVNGKKYRLFSSVNFNRLKNDFNGGVVDPTFVTDSINYSIPEIKIKLSQTGSDIRFFDGKLQHQFLLLGQNFKSLNSTKAGLKHELRYSK
ncbi:MAG TPA: hypothetical protein PK990_09475, partial [Salinivirgaceae bacterium]|nr:hypothetical protein [Salinivirgaceae bacterium]